MTAEASRPVPVPLAIVGGGAAGLFAAAVAADRRLGCLVLERKARVGAKMLMTANGRCNFTKDIPPERMLADVGEPVASFVRKALMECPPSHVAAGFRALGVRAKRMADGRLFPASEKAADIVHAFGDMLRDKEIPVATNCAVMGVRPKPVGGFVVATKGFTLDAANVLVCTGGVSFPKTGSVGDGQEFARALGHRVEPFRAGLVGFELRAPRIARYEEASARVRVGGAVVCEYRGEVEFERWGVSGAAVYNCQRWTARHLRPGEPFEVDLAFGGERMTLRNPVARSVKEAIVTVGGVSMSDVDPETMESRKVPGLYFAGEVLDIDGPTGGYNLTLAFATARLAVTSVFAKRGGRAGAYFRC